MALFAWDFHSTGRLIEADNWDDAYEKAIAFRMRDGGQTREEAEEWFEKEDVLLEVEGEVIK